MKHAVRTPPIKTAGTEKVKKNKSERKTKKTSANFPVKRRIITGVKWSVKKQMKT